MGDSELKKIYAIYKFSERKLRGLLYWLGNGELNDLIIYYTGSIFFNMGVKSIMQGSV